MSYNDEHLYTLTRSQFAKSIGKSTGSVRISMRRGGYKDDYIFKNGQYFFRPRESTRSNYDPVPTAQVKNVPTQRAPSKASKGSYENIKGNNGKKFKEYNKKSQLMALQKDIPIELADKYVSEFDSWYAEKNKQNSKRVLNADKKMNLKNYGGPIRTQGRTGLVSWSTPWTELNPKPKDEYEKALEELEPYSPYFGKYY